MSSSVARRAALVEPPSWTFEDRLRKARMAVARQNQHRFAAELGLTQAAYGAYETGRHRPRDVVAFAKRVEMLTGVPATWLLGLDEAPVAAASSAAEITTEAGVQGKGINPHCSPSPATARFVHGSTVRVGPLGEDPAATWAAVA